MPKMILTLTLLAACSAREAAPMSGACVDRLAPNLFDASAADVPFKECRWRNQTWVCRLERGSDAWRCVAISKQS
jgi:hypothetical protein